MTYPHIPSIPALAHAAVGRGEQLRAATQESSETVTAVLLPDEIEGRCVHCRGPLPEPLRPRSGRGRRRRFCSHACREAARLRREQGLPESTPRVRPGGRHRLRDRLADQEDR